MQKIKLKKILTVISTLAITTPVSLSVIACYTNEENKKNDYDINEDINENINNLKNKITALTQISNDKLYAGTTKGEI